LSLCAHGNARFQLQTPGQRPGGAKAISFQAISYQSKSDFLSVKAISYQSVNSAPRATNWGWSTAADGCQRRRRGECPAGTGFRDDNMETLAKASHDLESVSGRIGMPETSALAAKMQDDFLNG
jgi:hypothetical protein